MDYDPRSEPHHLAHDPTTSLVVPRPIGWITSLSPSGVVNLAPYSYFNLVASQPPFVMFSSNSRKHSQIVIGGVINVHIDDAVIVDGMIDVSKLRAIARLGYRGEYTVVDHIFEMPRVNYSA